MRPAVRTWIDLASKTARNETLPEKKTRFWGGERGLALPVLLEKLDRETDPLSPENTLVVAAGLLNGLAFSGTCRYGVYAKSPLTGALGESEAGGTFGPAMKAQGIDPDYSLLDEIKVDTGGAPTPRAPALDVDDD